MGGKKQPHYREHPSGIHSGLNYNFHGRGLLPADVFKGGTVF